MYPPYEPSHQSHHTLDFDLDLNQAPSLSHSSASTRSEGMDLDSNSYPRSNYHGYPYQRQDQSQHQGQHPHPYQGQQQMGSHNPYYPGQHSPLPQQQHQQQHQQQQQLHQQHQHQASYPSPQPQPPRSPYLPHHQHHPRQQQAYPPSPYAQPQPHPQQHQHQHQHHHQQQQQQQQQYDPHHRIHPYQQQQQHHQPYPFQQPQPQTQQQPHPQYPHQQQPQQQLPYQHQHQLQHPSSPFKPPQLDNNNQTEDKCHLLTPSSGRSVETEMPSLAFSEGNSTSSKVIQQQSPRLGHPSPSPSLSPQAADGGQEVDGDYFLTSVLNMIAPTGIPPVTHYDYLSEFTQRQRIAKGGNGEIRRAYWPLRQSVVILKSLIDTKHTPAKIAKLFDKEVEVMNQCRQHDNIVHFYGIAIRNSEDERNGERFMIMQYYEHGDLVKLLETPQHQPDAPTLTDKLFLAMDIATGLEHLFKCGFHHGDLHPKNILIDLRRTRTPEQGRYLARLTDFGLRRVRDSKNAFSSQQFGGVWQFMAPERMTKNRPRYDVRCDIFALGVIYWQIMSGRYPFKDPTTFTPNAREGRIEGTPQWYYNLYTQAWSDSPDNRQQSLEEIVQVFRYHLGIRTLPKQYLDPSYASPYPTPHYGYDSPAYSSYSSHDPNHPHSGASGATMRGASPMMTPSMLTPSSYQGHIGHLPPSPLLTNSVTARGTGS